MRGDTLGACGTGGYIRLNPSSTVSENRTDRILDVISRCCSTDIRWEIIESAAVGCTFRVIIYYTPRQCSELLRVVGDLLQDFSMTSRAEMRGRKDVNAIRKQSSGRAQEPIESVFLLPRVMVSRNSYTVITESTQLARFKYGCDNHAPDPCRVGD